MAPTVLPDDIYPYEDSFSELLTDFDFSDLEDLMVDASNEVMLIYGDSFDFVGFFLNFTPDHQIGAAFYDVIENDVNGIGDIGLLVGEPLPTFNLRPDIGLAGDNVEGFVMMWVVDDWVAGAAPAANQTRLVLGQEFEHRFGMFLPPLLDGNDLQGDDMACGRSFHWSWRVDGQGSSMEISDWSGSSPAVLLNSSISFNTDIPGGVFSYTDLYLMGYVSAAEMDAGNSDLRILEGSDCVSDFSGTITPFDSAKIIASAGPRIPDSTGEDKDYRTAWVMIHLPGAPPTTAEIDLAVGILNQHSTDWASSTLGLGSMDNTLPPKPTATGAPYNGIGVNPIVMISQPAVIGGVWSTSIDTSVRAQATLAILVVRALPSTGLILAGGEVLVDLISSRYLTAQATPVAQVARFDVPVPSDPALTGLTATAQGVVLGGGYTLCNAYSFTVGF